MIATRLDHLVVAARSLEQGVAWCEATLGVTPGPGGQHPLMGTHNRLLRLDGAAFPRSYLEIIAIDPLAPRPGHPRWFGLDEPALQDLLEAGPRLIHMVCASDAADAACAQFATLGVSPGSLRAAERPTPHGILRWRISIRDDGRRQLDGLAPTIIEWGDKHPTDTMPSSNLELEAVEAHHPQAGLLRQGYAAIGLSQIEVHDATANLVARLRTPRGAVSLASGGA